MNARVPKSYTTLPRKEKELVVKAAYSEAAKNASKIAVEIADKMTSERLAMAIECCIVAGMITLTRDFDFGTDASKLGKRQSKLLRYTDGVLETLSHAAGRYDDAMLAGLHFQAGQLGIDISQVKMVDSFKSREAIEREILERLRADSGTADAE